MKPPPTGNNRENCGKQEFDNFDPHFSLLCLNK